MRRSPESLQRWADTEDLNLAGADPTAVTVTAQEARRGCVGALTG
ncbi:hypothetical protein [Streptomyces heilongjiangensis]|uniref:Transposase n=1 Tax=Streptomyces heilongjiangensis TaxID=945052 RepID=A0ABW1BHK9_9ACTN|nr:hypothetical protein [Streptomyces heilongjiangensis]MDC2950594.1 hypothetical protein [Streptomyces heilongjiangensis]